MGAIDGPASEIGDKVGAALVGTFLGILLSYGFFGPMAVQRWSKQLKEEITWSVPPQVGGVHPDLLFEVIAGVNWTEIAEDLLAH